MLRLLFIVFKHQKFDENDVDLNASAFGLRIGTFHNKENSDPWFFKNRPRYLKVQ
jgi:hypothetical protein